MKFWVGILDIMDAALKLRVGSVVGFLTGLLTATGHLDATSANQTANDITAFIGGILTLISAFYFFEHSFMQVKEDLKHIIWEDPKEVSVTETTPPTATTPTV